MLARGIGKVLWYMRFWEKLRFLEPTKAQKWVVGDLSSFSCSVTKLLCDLRQGPSRPQTPFSHLNFTIKRPLVAAFVISP